MLETLVNLRNKKELLTVGLMSGTSQDGIDTVLVKIKGYGKETEFNVLEFDTYDYPNRLKEKLHEITTVKNITLKDLTRLDYAIAYRFADSTKKICKKAGIKTKDLDLIGSHGQTIIHLPKEKYFCGEKIKATNQIGEPSIIAKETNTITVADFRPCDIALGGEGAPLTIYTDYILFSSNEKNRAIINIGGITNISVLKKNSSLDDIEGFDIGPGNMCINEAMNILYNKDYDEDGKTAKKGKVNKELLEKMLENHFFDSNLKSTGRFHFGANYVKDMITRAKNTKKEDIIATFTELTAYTISRCINKINLDEVIMCGGGYKNPVMMKSIKEKSPQIMFTDITNYGMSEDNREAIAFAILANEAISGNPSNVGKKRGILGKIVFP